MRTAHELIPAGAEAATRGPEIAATGCHKCGREIADGAKPCPHCGAKRSNVAGRLLLAVVALFALVIIGVLLGRNESAVGANAHQVRAELVRIPYRVVEDWSRGDLVGQAIVIDPRYRNEADLKRLAETLRRDTSQVGNAFVQIFDDSVAAANRRAAGADRLGPKDLAHYDAHSIGFYNRNATTGYHSIMITLGGMDSPAVEIRM
jgi:RNA polymerase subunit RPABC4/transcription elongation factor Spt4